MSIGPVEYMVVAFPGNKFTGQIAPALAELVESNTIRIIDLAFVAKDADGSIAAFELSDLDPDIAALFDPTGAAAGGLFNEDDLASAGEELEPNSSAALLVWEDVWATKLADADPRGRRRAVRLGPHPPRRRRGGDGVREVERGRLRPRTPRRS